MWCFPYATVLFSLSSISSIKETQAHLGTRWHSTGALRERVPRVTTQRPRSKGGPGSCTVFILYLGHRLLLKTNQNFTNLQLL